MVVKLLIPFTGLSTWTSLSSIWSMSLSDDSTSVSIPCSAAAQADDAITSSASTPSLMITGAPMTSSNSRIWGSCALNSGGVGFLLALYSS